MVTERINAALLAHNQATQQFIDRYRAELVAVAARLSQSFKQGGKLLVCGNGGSACDAMHIAGEFVGRFVDDRPALPAIALSADSGAITAIGNDYGFEYIFSRQVEAYGKEGDVLIAMSTSGSSPNILAALKTARERKLFTVLLTGEKGKASKELADVLLAVPALETARIQEVHIFALHLLATLVEAELWGR